MIISQRTRKVITGISTGLAALMVAGGGVAKLAGIPAVTGGLAKAGVGPYIPALGVAELVFTALFLLPKTMRLGFLLLCCYFGGAIATDLSHQSDIFRPVLPLVLIWISAFIRDRSLFLSQQRTEKMIYHERAGVSGDKELTLKYDG